MIDNNNWYHSKRLLCWKNVTNALILIFIDQNIVFCSFEDIWLPFSNLWIIDAAFWWPLRIGDWTSRPLCTCLAGIWWQIDGKSIFDATKCYPPFPRLFKCFEEHSRCRWREREREREKEGEGERKKERVCVRACVK